MKIVSGQKDVYLNTMNKKKSFQNNSGIMPDYRISKGENDKIETETSGINEISVTMRKKLNEIASFQSHQIRGPIATILGLYLLFRFDDPSNPINGEILPRLKVSIETLDGLSWEIVKKTMEIRNLGG